MTSLGKLLIVFGIVLVGLGFLITFYDKIPYLGKLPGDIHIKRENFQLYFPITTSVVLSFLLTLVLWIISLISKK
jgi:hypothetical protein